MREQVTRVLQTETLVAAQSGEPTRADADDSSANASAVGPKDSVGTGGGKADDSLHMAVLPGTQGNGEPAGEPSDLYQKIFDGTVQTRVGLDEINELRKIGSSIKAIQDAKEFLDRFGMKIVPFNEAKAQLILISNRNEYN
jgi:hypothetical protein